MLCRNVRNLKIADKKVSRLLLLPPQLLHAQQEVQLGQLAALQELPESEIADKKVNRLLFLFTESGQKVNRLLLVFTELFNFASDINEVVDRAETKDCKTLLHSCLFSALVFFSSMFGSSPAWL